MVKVNSFILFITLFSIHVYSQNLEEKIAKKACSCIHKTKEFNDLNKLMQKCLIGAKISIEEEIPTKDRKNTVEEIRKTISEALNILTKYCKAPIASKIGIQKERLFYQLSKNDSANIYFKKGNQYKASNKYDLAIKSYKKAIKTDAHFVIAYDKLASIYQSQNKLNQAITIYKKSLNSFPEGSTALLNIALLYFKLKENEKASYYYLQLINNHPENPEGYYGLANTEYTQEKNENALRSLLNALLYYKTPNSNKPNKAEKLLDLIYNRMKNENTLNTFYKVTKEYNFTYKK